MQEKRRHSSSEQQNQNNPQNRPQQPPLYSNISEPQIPSTVETTRKRQRTEEENIRMEVRTPPYNRYHYNPGVPSVAYSNLSDGQMRQFAYNPPSPPNNTVPPSLQHQRNNDTNNNRRVQNYPTNRRQSVSGESIRPSEDPNDRIVYPKSDELKRRLYDATIHNLLFKDIDRETKLDVIDAMHERIVKKNEQIFAQGDNDDIFYVVEHGIFHVIYNNHLYLELANGSSFGEHALMYDVARTATVVANTDGILWAINRETFQRTVSNRTHRKQSTYKSLLRSVPFLSSLSLEEISKIADALEPMSFENDDTIISQGDLGENFYVIEEGHVSVSRSEHGLEQQLAPLSSGDYFGEFTLFNNSPRNRTTVVAQGLVHVLALKRDNFIRLLGPMMDIVRRNAAQYHPNTTDITDIRRSSTTSSTSTASTTISTISNNDSNPSPSSSPSSSSSSSTRTRKSGYSGAGGVDVL